MGYSTVADVKIIFGITETTWDNEISGCINNADTLINNKLSMFTSVPLENPIPPMICIASKYLAAALFRLKPSLKQGKNFGRITRTRYEMAKRLAKEGGKSLKSCWKMFSRLKASEHGLRKDNIKKAHGLSISSI